MLVILNNVVLDIDVKVLTLKIGFDDLHRTKSNKVYLFNIRIEKTVFKNKKISLLQNKKINKIKFIHLKLKIKKNYLFNIKT